MSRRSTPYHNTYQDCGNAYDTYSNKCQRCRDCARLRSARMDSERRRQRLADQIDKPSRRGRPQGSCTNYRLVYDPCEYPLARGMGLTDLEVKAMLSYETFVPGTVLATESGQVRVNDGYKLEAV